MEVLVISRFNVGSQTISAVNGRIAMARCAVSAGILTRPGLFDSQVRVPTVVRRFMYIVDVSVDPAHINSDTMIGT